MRKQDKDYEGYIRKTTLGNYQVRIVDYRAGEIIRDRMIAGDYPNEKSARTEVEHMIKQMRYKDKESAIPWIKVEV